MRLHIRHLFLVMLTFGVFVASAVPACAGILLSSEAVSTSPGGTGFVQILLQNDFPTSQSLSGFSVEIGLGGTGVRFTGVDDLTSPGYVFDGFGLGDLTFDLFPNSGFIASDISLNSDGFVDIAPGQTTGIARISFEVDAAAESGLRAITFVSGLTTLFTDAVGAPFAESDVSLSNGSIDVQASNGVVPEPSSITLFGIGFGCALAARRRSLKNLSSDDEVGATL